MPARLTYQTRRGAPTGLLTEDAETIRKFMIFVEDNEEFRNSHQHLPTDAVDLVKKVQTTGVILPQIKEKLKALGIQPNP